MLQKFVGTDLEYRWQTLMESFLTMMEERQLFMVADGAHCEMKNHRRAIFESSCVVVSYIYPDVCPKTVLRNPGKYGERIGINRRDKFGFVLVFLNLGGEIEPSIGIAQCHHRLKTNKSICLANRIRDIVRESYVT